MKLFAKLEDIIVAQAAQADRPPTPADVLRKEGTPSASIAVLSDGSIVAKCLSSDGNDEETLFQACSISKTIAGSVCARMCQCGLFKLDDRIVPLLPESAVRALETGCPRELLEQIRINHLLSHTSGLSVHGFPGYVSDLPDALAVIQGRFPVNTAQIRLDGVPGYAFSYSGGGITVLQLLLEHVAGKSFEALALDYVFSPLAMNRSCYRLVDGEENVARAHYTGFTACEDAWRTNPEQAAAGYVGLTLWRLVASNSSSKICLT